MAKDFLIIVLPQKSEIFRNYNALQPCFQVFDEFLSTLQGILMHRQIFREKLPHKIAKILHGLSLRGIGNRLMNSRILDFA